MAGGQPDLVAQIISKYAKIQVVSRESYTEKNSLSFSCPSHIYKKESECVSY